MPDQNKDPFYVGYLPLPATIKRFILPWVVGNLVLAVAVGAVIAQQHRDPGDGTWDTGQATTIDGTLIIDPYPLLVTDEGHTYILVEQGKLGVQQRIADEQIQPGPASVTGFVIEREGRAVLELDGAIDAPLQAKPQTQAQATLVDRDRLPEFSQAIADREAIRGPHTLVGEIVDPKCYLGVMQPGDGKTHRICATLCIIGGIPPMLLVRNEAGDTAAYLLVDADGNPFPESHYEFIAEPIEITGQVYRIGDLLALRADLGSIQRLEQ